jgi:hypothetical protein
MTHSVREQHLPTTSRRDTVEDLLQGRLIRIGDQPASKVFLQRLMCARSTLPQHTMGVIWNVLDLHAGHGAILAPLAPQCK